MTIKRTYPWEVRIVLVIIFKPAESRWQVRPSREFADVLTVGEIAFEGGHESGFVRAKDLEG